MSNRGLDGSFSTIAPYDRPLVIPDVTVSIDNFRLKFVYSQTAYDFDTKKRYDIVPGNGQSDLANNRLCVLKSTTSEHPALLLDFGK